MKKKLIVGGPGTGKTTDLMGLLYQYLQSGVRPDKIALVSFTKKAADEAATRAMAKFNLVRNDLPYFRTIHSLCFQSLGLSRGDLLEKANYDELSKLLGVTFTGQVSLEEGIPSGRCNGDQLLFLHHLARTRCVSLEQQYHDLNDELNWHQLKQFSNVYNQYKKDTGLIDFTDMLEQYIESCPPVDVDVAIIDEGQDLSKLQWKVAEHAFQNVREITVAGDDDQAIYRWSGADVNSFLNYTKDIRVLQFSHRLPRRIFTFANSISSQIKNRIDKDWNPKDEEGLIEWHTAPDDVDLLEGEWLLLARNIHLLPNLEQIAQYQGVPYTFCGQTSINKKHIEAIQAWEDLRKGNRITYNKVLLIYEHLKVGKGLKRGAKNLGKGITQPDYSLEDLKGKHGLLTEDIWHEALEVIPLKIREYYLSIRRRGGSLLQPPKVHINTIHGVKGGEAEKVLLLTDMARRSYDEYRYHPDDEHRVFYTGVTRAKKELHIIMPQSNMFYEF